MVTENDPSARMQIRSRGELQLPGSCYVCGNGTCDEGYVDFGTFVDYHGSFYMCLICAKQLAELLGWFSPDEVQTTQALLNTYVTSNEELRKELDSVRPIIAAIRDVFGSTVSIDPGSLSLSVEASTEQRPFIEDAVAGSEDRESDSEESDNSAGRTNSRRAAKRNFTVVE